MSQHKRRVEGGGKKHWGLGGGGGVSSSAFQRGKTQWGRGAGDRGGGQRGREGDMIRRVWRGREGEKHGEVERQT